MGAYITRRLLWTLLLLWVVSGITFIVFNVLPSADPALLRAGRRAEPEIVQNIRETFGLDKPLYVQYWNYMKDVFLHFDFGRSYRNDVDVRAQLLDRLPNTLLLIAGAVVVWLIIGLTVGMISAVKRGSFLDRFSMTLALICISAPVYWLGLVVLYLFSDDIGRFPLLPGLRLVLGGRPTRSRRPSRCSCRGSCWRPRSRRSTPDCSAPTCSR